MMMCSFGVVNFFPFYYMNEDRRFSRFNFSSVHILINEQFGSVLLYSAGSASPPDWAIRYLERQLQGCRNASRYLTNKEESVNDAVKVIPPCEGIIIQYAINGTEHTVNM